MKVLLRLPYALAQWSFCAIIYLGMILMGLTGVVYGLVGDGQHRTPWLWVWWGRVEDIPEWWYQKRGDRSRLTKWLWMAIRNPVSGIDQYIPREAVVEQYGSIDESLPGFQWRYRHTKFRDSFRMVWGDPDPQDGKHEFYIGFKIGPDVDNTSFTVQLR